MGRRGRAPNLRERLAAALLQLQRFDDHGRLVPLVDRARAKSLTAREIIALFETDHDPVPVALGGTNHPSNLVHRLVREHREKTATKDVPAIAKSRRVSRSHEEHRRRMLAKSEGVDGPPESTGRWRSRTIGGTRASGWRRHMDGTVSRRDS